MTLSFYDVLMAANFHRAVTFSLFVFYLLYRALVILLPVARFDALLHRASGISFLSGAPVVEAETRIHRERLMGLTDGN